MIKCASLYTYEVDNDEIAFDEIKAQLDEKITLLENTVGIVMCHTEFINTGVLKYICDKLSFDLVGITTASQAVNSEVGELMLTIFVITSDDVVFKTGVTERLNEDVAGSTKAAYDQAAMESVEPLKLAFVFAPFLLKHAGDSYVNVWEKIIPNTPLFGALPTDDTISFDGCETIHNGVSYKTEISFVLCYGNMNPRFLIGTLSEDNIMPYKGEVTKSEGPFVHEINNMKAYDYFEEIGFASNGAPAYNFLFVPFMIDLKKRGDYDGIPVMRGFASFTEDGAVIFRGNVDENSIFYMSKFSADDVISSTLQKIEEINNMADVNGMLSFSCITRHMVLGTNPLLELEGVKDKMSSHTSFMMGYVGGEICPTSIRNGVPTNRFHNYSLVTLII